MISLGVDPDTQCSGLALVQDGEVIHVEVVDCRSLRQRGVKAAVSMCDAIARAMLKLPFQGVQRVVIEGQQDYKRGVNTVSLLLLAHVSGAAASAGKLLTPNVEIVRPWKWKGQVPKKIHHKRLKDKFGPLGTLPGGDKIPRAHHKEAWDAIGMADWGQK